MAHILADEIAFNGADVGTILSEIQNGTYGLAALKSIANDIAFICDDQILGRIINATYGLEALNADLDTLLARLTAARAGYLDILDSDSKYIRTTALTGITGYSLADLVYISATEKIRDFIAKTGGTVLPASKSLYDVIALDRLDHATYGLSALKTEIDANETKIDTVDTVVDAIKVKTDNLPSDPADESELETRLAHKVSCMTWWSDIDDVINLTTDGVDINLPSVVVAGIPSGATLVMAVAILKARAIENKSSSGYNAINGAQSIRVKKSTGAWGTDDIAAIDLADNQWSVAASTREFGDVQVGDNDVKSEVDGNATYNLRFENPIVDYATLDLKDVQVGIKIWFY